MTNTIHLPFNKQTTIVSTNQYPIIGSNENLQNFCYIARVTKNISLGNLVDFLDNDGVFLGGGIVSYIDFEYAFLKPCYSLKQHPNYYKIKPYFQEFVPEFQIIRSDVFLSSKSKAVLSAKCQVVNEEEYKSGFISWSLLYEDELCLLGHDYYTPMICFYQKEKALWVKGSYRLVAERYNNYGLLMSQDQRTWILDTPTNVLSCGEYNDSLKSLIL